MATGLALAGAARAARAQDRFPDRPLRLVVGFAPGGPTDVFARRFVDRLQRALGQTVVIENKAGANGANGASHVKGQPADGYTLLVSHASVHVFSTATMPSLPFHPINDFTHVGLLVEASNVLLVKANSPYRTLEEYLAAARTRPVRYGSSGIGSAPHLLGAMLAGESGAAELDHVPYRGSAPAMQDLMANQIESMIDPITTNVQRMKDGVLRALAVSTPQRLAAFPNVPTFAELGFPKLTSAQWLGLSAPKGLPQPIVERLTALIPAMLTRPELAARCEELQTLPRNPGLYGADFTALIQDQINDWSAVARQFNIVVT
jgi:tripartite-type tricarboxylate transporter receptor subunit TctC